MTKPTLRSVRTPSLEIAYESVDDHAETAIVLLHGFPYDVRAYDEVVSILAQQELRVIVPYLRGFGPTHFRELKAETTESNGIRREECTHRQK